MTLRIKNSYLFFACSVRYMNIIKYINLHKKLPNIVDKFCFQFKLYKN